MELKDKDEQAPTDGQPSQDKVVALPKEKRELTPTEQARIEKLKSKNPDPTTSKGNLVRMRGDKWERAIKESLPLQIAQEEHAARMGEATGFSHEQNSHALITSMVVALANPSETFNLEKWVEGFNQLGNLLAEFKPQDAIEGILISQAIVCQEKAFYLIRRSSLQENVKWAAQHSNFASKLLARSQEAIDKLIRYRRGGQQKVVVEYVNVEAGGKAAFGAFNTGGTGLTQKRSDGPYEV